MILLRVSLCTYRVISVMLLGINSACCFCAQSPAASPSFEVATVKPVEPDAKAGRFIVMQGENQFVAKNYTLKLLIAAAYDVSPKVITGGPAWMNSDRFDIEALTPGSTKPVREEQMAMLRALLTDRFKLGFHREPKILSIYELEVAKSGAKLKQSTAAPDLPAALIATVFSDHLHLPARNATMGEFVSVLQRAVLDRPVVDKTGLTAKYDFDLDRTADETQFGGEVPVAAADAPSAPFFIAIKQQLGLHSEAKKEQVDTFVVDIARRPTEN